MTESKAMLLSADSLYNFLVERGYIPEGARVTAITIRASASDPVVRLEVESLAEEDLLPLGLKEEPQ